MAEGSRISRAFLWEGWLGARSYPSSFVITQVTMLIPILSYYFVARLVDAPERAVGEDYYAFVVLGLVTWRLLSGAASIVASALQEALDQGRLEMLLVQPVSWRFLPLALAEWPLALRLANTAGGLAVAIALGARFRLGGMVLALVILALGVGATLAIAAAVASLTLLAKKSDSVLRIYSLAAGLLAGVFYPTGVMPAWVRTFSYLIPDTYVIAAVRRLALPGGAAIDAPSALATITGLVAFDLVMLPISIWLFGRVLNFGREAGMLGSY
jgi:ABC-2 type transport system permease protein